jgi:hypothetical protein
MRMGVSIHGSSEKRASSASGVEAGEGRGVGSLRMLGLLGEFDLLDGSMRTDLLP